MSSPYRMRPDGTARPRLLVAGLGNLLLKDDGVGVHAARAMNGSLRGRAVVAEVGTAVLSAMHLFERADTVLAIDAMKAGGSAGDLYLCPAADLASSGHAASLHEVTLVSALELIRGRRPEVWVLGVEPAEISYGLELSDSVQAALPRVLKEIERFVANRVSACRPPERASNY